MNISQALEALASGKYITHERWQDSFFYIDVRGNIADENGVVEPKDFIDSMACFTKGYHLFNRSCLHVNVGDKVLNLSYDKEYVVKVADKDCICLWGSGDTWTCTGSKWKSCHKLFKLVSP